MTVRNWFSQRLNLELIEGPHDPYARGQDFSKSYFLEKRRAIKKNWERPELEHGIPTKWLWVVWYPEGFVMGDRVDIGAYSCLFAHHGIVLEDEVQIGSHCSIYSLNTEDRTFGKVLIRERACIGSHSIILPGVTIGKDARIGAMSLVKRDVGEGETVYGVVT